VTKTAVHIRFRISVPASTPAEPSIHVVGSDPILGGWSHPGLLARRVRDRHYEAECELPRGESIEFKITRGTWASAEVFPSGTPRYNRHRRFQRAATVGVVVRQWADVRRRVRGPVGQNEQHLVPTHALGGERRVMVHLPPGYEAGNRAYPLLLMHDGQNLFDDATSYTGVKWAADETVDRLVRQGRMEPVIVAGVWNGPNRMREYHPERPLSKQYERFLVEELLPFLRQRYRLLSERTGVAGSSMGGIVSLHLAERRRSVFTRAGVISPSIFASATVAEQLEKHPLPPGGRRIWMDMGTLEGAEATAPGLERLRNALVRAGWGPELSFVIAQDGRHHEWDWSRRLPDVLAFLYPPRTEP
jgi:predicted alpha/beta superfamily hydrolase